MHCVYLTYDGLLDPLGQSQVIPYVRRLVTAGHSFTIISYEKEQRSQDEILALESSLSEVGIEWSRLPFKSGKVEIAKRIIFGILAVRKACRDKRPDIVHLRGFMSAAIKILSLLRVPHLYDFRSFALGEWTEFGKLRVESLPHRVLNLIDHRAVETACGLVVLEQCAESLLRQTYKVPRVPLKVIRTCTDVSLYRPRPDSVATIQKDPIRFVYLGGARRPYRPDLALRLVSQLLRAGMDCRVDFLNERDHADIHAAAEEVGFPLDKLSVLRLDHRDVPGALGTYDCGLIFYEPTPWRRVCSPTKLGEYLAAGVPAVGFEGVDVLEEFAASTRCVRIVRQKDLLDLSSTETANQVLSFIRQPGVGSECQELARREFGLDRAGRLYAELYAEIEARI